MTERRECLSIPGTMCPSLALLESCGSDSVHVIVDWTRPPSVNRTVSGLMAGSTFDVGPDVTRK